MRKTTTPRAASPLWLCAAIVSAGCTSAALAATVIGPEAPNAGTLLQDSKTLAPSSSYTMPAPSTLVVEPEMDASGPEGAPFLLKSFDISGNKIFDTPTLRGLVSDTEGQTVSLKRLDTVLARIGDYYHAHGYPLARAIVPAQKVVGGVLKVMVIEGKYGEVKIDNKSNASTAFLEELTAPLKKEAAISQAGLDQAMLTLAELPGVTPSAVLKPGKDVGTADLEITTPAASAVRGTVSLDNFGNAYTGRARIGGNIDWLEPLHHGDVASLSLLTSGADMDYARLSYEGLLTASGTSAGVAVSALQYKLAGPLAGLGGHGSSLGESLWGKQTLMRSMPATVSVQVQLDHKTVQDDIDSIALKNARALTNFSLNLLAVLRDKVLAGAQSVVNVVAEVGRNKFTDAGAQAADASSANSQGRFLKLSFNLSRLQSLDKSDLVYLSLNGQLGNKNLDPTEKLVLGGPASVRGYDASALSVDQGVVATLEYRRELGELFHMQWQALAFLDFAHADIDHAPWVASQANSVNMSSAGLGASFATDHNLRARLMLAKRLGTVPAAIGTASSAHVWFDLTQGF